MSAPPWWRSLEEHAEDPAYVEAVAREFPAGADLLKGVDRRRFLQLMAASAALAGLSGCASLRPRHIVPRVEPVPDETAGVPYYVATSTVEGGYGTGVLLLHRMGRPIKVEGNPDHPASLGASDASMQATILDLYDPGRSAAVLSGGQIDSWDAVALTLATKRQQWSKNGGAGLRILTGDVTSPTLAAQLAALTKRYPEARWHAWEPLSRAAEDAGAMLAFGTPVAALPRFDKADVVLAIESDAISAAPGHLAFARAFAARRRAAETGTGAMSRVYAIEATPTLIGAVADHRFVLKPAEIEPAVRALAAALGAGPAAWHGGSQPPWVEAVAHDLALHHGAALVHAGPEQPAAIHAIVHAINAALGAPGNTVHYIPPAAVPAADLKTLAGDMHAGKVETLLILDANPVYDAPADLGFAAALKRVKLSVQLATHVDETARQVTYHLPALHMFEMWSDARAFDGTASILQPQVSPMVDGHSAAEIVARFAGAENPHARDLVQAQWRGRAGGDFVAAWTGWLRRGLIDGTAAAEAKVAVKPGFADALPSPAASGAGIAILLRPDPFLRHGDQANNGWLQELPRPFSRITWDNAALIAPATAKRLKIRSDDVVELAAANGATIRLAALVLPGQAADCVTVALGYGRRAIGKVGEGVGADAYPMRDSAALWQVAAVSLRRTGSRHVLARTQRHQNMQGRDIVRTEPLDAFRHGPQAVAPAEKPTLYAPYPYTGNAWAMAISLNSCIGCGACVAACQAENNSPVVGREQVLDDREMHWLRVDCYWGGEPEQPKVLFQPVPCMHCEDAPCEVVCPVDATMHDSDGLNVMVYNRCVGTRFCSNNCPYKVRRFNFHNYTARDPRPAIAWNPDVTVRARGVMEKCTYCLQRIRETKITADRENRPIHDGEVRTACQQACPTQAIVFGDQNDPHSAVRARKATPLNYALLEELNTRPRTTYAARLTNRNPAIVED